VDVAISRFHRRCGLQMVPNAAFPSTKAALLGSGSEHSICKNG
jgi:hypothetical protein